MSAVKKLLTALLAVLVAAAVFAGIRWNRENYVLVDLHFYPKNEAVLDLRGKNLPVPRYEKLKSLLPDCRILWDVPLSGGSATFSGLTPDTQYNLSLEVECFHRLPCTIADTFAMLVRQGEKNFQFIVMRLLVDLQYHTTNVFAIHNDTVGFAFWIVDGFFNRCA